MKIHRYGKLHKHWQRAVEQNGYMGIYYPLINVYIRCWRLREQLHRFRGIQYQEIQPQFIELPKRYRSAHEAIQAAHIIADSISNNR